MSPTEQSLKEGNLDNALRELQNQIKKEPANIKMRIFLFELLCILGDWNRALTQLNVSCDLDMEALPMVQIYREVIACEWQRKDIFLGYKPPQIFGEPQQWMAYLLQALKLNAEEQYKGAQLLRDQAFEQAPATAGTINGEAFEWLADADSRLGPMLEAIINGQYYWIPFSQIQAIKIEKPTDLRDLVWMPAHFTWTNGGQTAGLIPTRYPNSESQEDTALKLARKTEWLNLHEETFLGLGQRLLSTNKNDYALMDIREIKFDQVN